MRKRISFLLVFLLFASVSNGWVAPEVIPTVFCCRL